MPTKPSNPFRTELDRLGLQEDPFQLSADPRYLYLGEEHQEVYKIIQAVILKRRGLALVVGEPGTGKSSLARYVYDRLYGRDGIDVAYVDTSNFGTRAGAARKISQSFEKIKVDVGSSYGVQMENFKQQLVDVYNQGRIAVLLLDDAQKLGRPSLEMLHEMYNFDFGEKVITVVAFGEVPAVQNFYRYPSIGSRLYTIQTLKSVSYETTLQMVAFRLQVAGCKKSLFSEEAFDRLYKATEGNPREVVILCSMALDALIDSASKRVTGPMMDTVADQYLRIKKQRLNER
jgi:general secretion pathway protein A